MAALAGVLGGGEEGEATGELLLDGVSPARSRGRVGLVLQDPDSQVILARVGDDVAFGCENLGVPRNEIWSRVFSALEAVGLDVSLDHPTSQLSGGQKQRLALAGVLAMQPGLLLLDEPTANLDAAGITEVQDAVARVAETSGATLVVVEHRVDVWLPLVDRVIVLAAGGGVLADGTPTDVLAQQGRHLATQGVWVPGFAPQRPNRIRAHGGGQLLAAESLGIGRSNILRDSLSISVSAGEAVAVTGPNGAGKSTLGLTLAGLLPPCSGAVVARAELARGLAPHPIRWKSRDLLTRIGTVFQDPEHQFLSSTVRAELEIGPRALRLPEAGIVPIIDNLLSRLRLDHLAEANPFTLSGGEKRRLSVATVLATAPQILVLDEPTFGQDSRTWTELVALLATLIDDGSAVVAITHDADFVAALADREFAL